MQTLLVATDFSLPASNAVNYAVSLARYINARIVLVNAYPMPVAGDPQIPIDFSVVSEASFKALEELKSKLLQGHVLSIECYSAMGTAYNVIEQARSRFNADMVVLGMTGEAGKLKERLIGSTAVSVGREFKIPVLIVPEGASYRRIHRISLACDADKLAESTLLLCSAHYFETLFDAELEIVTVQKPEEHTEWRAPESYSFNERTMGKTKHRQVFVKDNDAATALEYYFKFHHTDLIMVNPKKHSFFERLFSESVTKHLAFHSRVPLLLIRNS